jgi:biotin carboxyl carrier protein
MACADRAGDAGDVEMKFVVRINDEEKTVVVTETNGYYDIELDGKSYQVDCQYFGDRDFLSLLIDNKSYLIESAPLKAEDGRYYARVMGRHYDVEVLDELLVAVRDAQNVEQDTDAYSMVSPMPGLILDVKAKVGDQVKPGDPLVIMEAMKMQNELAAEFGGVVKEILVAPSQTVDSQTPLIVIERA